MWRKGILGREKGTAVARGPRQRWQNAHESREAPLALHSKREWREMRSEGGGVVGRESF